jgi:broad specificity phosphatase PhoE
MTRPVVTVRLVRHGRASAGWDTDPDPDLDATGWMQAHRLAERIAPEGPMALACSPLQRCRSTAQPLEVIWSSTAEVTPAVAEIPSPAGIEMRDRVRWLRTAMDGTWAQLEPAHHDYRNAVVQWVARLSVDTVVVSHFVAINAVIGACLGDDRVLIRHLDNCSVTVVAVESGGLRLIEAGHEADTLIR